jgi:hypothetical protein
LPGLAQRAIARGSVPFGNAGSGINDKGLGQRLGANSASARSGTVGFEI